ncbi:hypothetical protein EV426DRAFT_709065 [Tirmania nivea]|nr:hypothetical protein EV426DRAFT_709065 [Tirmania nivea]
MEGSGDFTKGNVSDLVLYVIGPILSGFHRRAGRNVRLRREKEIISTDNETGGKEEFVVVDLVDVGVERMEGLLKDTEDEASEDGVNVFIMGALGDGKWFMLLTVKKSSVR